MNKQEELVRDQLSKVQFADLSNYNKETNTYYIPKINQIKLNVNSCYIVKIKDSIKDNEVLRINYNQSKEPEIDYYLIDVVSILNKVIKVNAIKYNIKEEKTENIYWNGYLSIKDVEIIKEC